MRSQRRQPPHDRAADGELLDPFFCDHGAGPRLHIVANRHAREPRTVEATSSSSSGPSTPPTRARSAIGRTSWTPPRCRPGRSPGNFRASAVAVWRRRASSSTSVGRNSSASARPAEKLVWRANCARTPSNSSVVVVRSGRPDADVIAAAREEVARLDPALPVYGSNLLVAGASGAGRAFPSTRSRVRWPVRSASARRRWRLGCPCCDARCARS